MQKCAVLLSGCGHLDGSEIRKPLYLRGPGDAGARIGELARGTRKLPDSAPGIARGPALPARAMPTLIVPAPPDVAVLGRDWKRLLVSPLLFAPHRASPA
jgi:hypothetical protein